MTTDRRPRRPKRPANHTEAPVRSDARATAFSVLSRIDADGAFANLAIGPVLDRSDLSDRDRRFTTDLVYGTTRMRRALDSAIDRFVDVDPDDDTRRLLRLGAYQLLFADVAPYAAVGETVALAPRRTRGFVNAVLRRIAELDNPVWPSEWVELSYPDWIGEVLVQELGHDDALAAMATMNTPPPVTVRSDGYTQDQASQWVAAAVGGARGERILDVCSAPGGKATAVAHTGAQVVAADRSLGRLGLVRQNAASVAVDPQLVAADGTRPPFADASFDGVLLDAPCSGLGALRRRPDARWRIQPDDVVDLAGLQARLLAASASLVRPGGRLIYSVCTLTAAESIDHPTPAGFSVDPTPPTDGAWRPFGPGWRVLPQDADTDGMILIRYRRDR